MGKLSFAALAVVALMVSACTSDGAVDETTTTIAAQSPTTAASPADTTTSTAPETTTAAEPAEPAPAANPELEALMASLGSGNEPSSGRMEGLISMTGLDDSETGLSEIEFTFSSAFDNESGDSSFLMDFSSLEGALEVDPDDPFAALASGFLGEIEFRQIGDRVFLKFPFFTAMFGAATDWISMPAEDGEEFTSGFEFAPTDPDEFLDVYRDADAEVEDLGEEEVNGVAATHYRITFDLEKLELTAEELAELEESGIFTEGILPIELWISEEGYVIRMLMEIDGTTVEAPAGEEFESMTLRYDFFDINEPVAIDEPPASEVTAIEDLEGFDFGFDLDG